MFFFKFREALCVFNFQTDTYQREINPNELISLTD